MRSTQAHFARFHRRFHTALIIALVGLGAAALGPGAAWAQTDTSEAFIGSWTGTFEIRPGVEARPVFHIERADDGALTASMDDPDDGLTGVPVSSVSVDGDSLVLDVDSLDARFEGVMTEADTTIEGTWMSSGRSRPLTLTPAGPEASVPTRYRERPEANPADVKSPDAIVSAFYDVISVGKKDSVDWNRYRSLFLPEARGIETGRIRGGGPRYDVFTEEDFVAWMKTMVPQLRKQGFVEREIHAETDRFGDIAHVFSTYETILSAKGPEPVARGINSFRLWHDGDRWWIVSLMYHGEREGAPLPERYTK
jgi:hypothetical protein